MCNTISAETMSNTGMIYVIQSHIDQYFTKGQQLNVANIGVSLHLVSCVEKLCSVAISVVLVRA